MIDGKVLSRSNMAKLGVGGQIQYTGFSNLADQHWCEICLRLIISNYEPNFGFGIFSVLRLKFSILP